MFRHVTPRALLAIVCVAMAGCEHAATSAPAREAEAEAPDAELRELNERFGLLLRGRATARSNYEEARLASLAEARRHDSLAAQYAKEHPDDPFYGPLSEPGWRVKAEAVQILDNLEREIRRVKGRIAHEELRIAQETRN